MPPHPEDSIHRLLLSIVSTVGGVADPGFSEQRLLFEWAKATATP